MRQHGVYYPETVNGLDNHLELITNAKKLFLTIPCTSTQNLYLEDVSSQGCDNVVFSSEAFCSFLNYLPDFFKFSNSSYIYYLRSPLTCGQSLFLQETVNFIEGFSARITFYDTIHLFQYVAWQRDMLEKFFSSGETRSRTLLRSFDLAVKNKGVCADFLEAIGLDADMSAFTPVASENSSLLAPYFLFLGHVSQLPLSRDALWQILHECYVLSAQDKRFPRYRFFSRRQIAEIPVELIHWYEALGKEMGDPDFWSRGEEALLKLEQCPYDQLPEDLQYDIFERLSAQSQKAILDVWPLRREIPDKLWGSAFLPDIPTTKAQAEFMRGWMRAQRLVSV